MSRVLVCGSRDWTNIESIRRKLSQLPTNTVIIHGGCRGADNMAGSVARQLGMEIEIYPAQWNLYGRAAGPIRNQEMLKKGKPDFLIAFHIDIPSSKGTWDMLLRGIRAGVPYHLVEN